MSGGNHFGDYAVRKPDSCSKGKIDKEAKEPNGKLVEGIVVVVGLCVKRAKD